VNRPGVSPHRGSYSATRPPRLPLPKHTILFLAANPLGTDRLALDREARAIQEELERSSHRDQFEFVTRWAVEPLDLLRALRTLKPTIVHFSGHGGRGELAPGKDARRHLIAAADAVPADRQQGLFFQGPGGGPQLVSTEALQEAFRAAGSSVKLVVLSACYSEVQAEALLAHVDYVVGMASSIRDDSARTFAIGFYGGLGERQPVSRAYQQGCAAISLEGLAEGERPRLRVRARSDSEGSLVATDCALLASFETGRAVRKRGRWSSFRIAIAATGCAVLAVVGFAISKSQRQATGLVQAGSMTIAQQKPETQGSVDIDVTGFESNTTETAGAADSASSHPIDQMLRPCGSYSELVAYSYKRQGSKLLIYPDSPLLKAMDNNSIASVNMHNFCGLSVGFDFPALAIKIANNTSDTIFMSEIVFEITKSALDTAPVFAIDSSSRVSEVGLGGISLYNEGWASVFDVQIVLTIDGRITASHTLKELDYGVFIDLLARSPPRRHEFDYSLFPFDNYLPIGRFNNVRSSDVTKHLNIFRRSNREVPIEGNLKFKTEDGRAHEYQFVTDVGFERCIQIACSSRPPTIEYHALLDADKTSYVERRPVSQAIKPGDVDHFLVRVGANRSAMFELIVGINDVRGRSLWKGSIDMNIFVPRSMASHERIALPIGQPARTRGRH
jgi:hypothetical protein